MVSPMLHSNFTTAFCQIQRLSADDYDTGHNKILTVFCALARVLPAAWYTLTECNVLGCIHHKDQAGTSTEADDDVRRLYIVFQTLYNNVFFLPGPFDPWREQVTRVRSLQIWVLTLRVTVRGATTSIAGGAWRFWKRKQHEMTSPGHSLERTYSYSKSANGILL